MPDQIQQSDLSKLRKDGVQTRLEIRENAVAEYSQLIEAGTEIAR